MENPLVSIIMPVFNGEAFVGKAIASILAQSYTNFELLIIDDGSTDNTDFIIKNFDDHRIKYISRENRGLVETLIQLVNGSSGALIARMDADDICHPDRIKVQVNRFLFNKNLVLHGCNVDYIDDVDTYLGSSVTVWSDCAIRYRMKSGNILFHPTVMFRRSVYEQCGGYSYKYSKYIEDYLLWTKMLKYGDVHIESKHLLRYRIHSNAISSNVPIGLNDIITKISLNKGEYDGLDSDYKLLICSERTFNNENRSCGYKMNKSLLSFVINLLDFKFRFLSKLQIK